MTHGEVVFLNAFQSSAGIYISFGSLKKFYLRFGEQTKTNYSPAGPVSISVTSPSGELLFKTRVTVNVGEKPVIAVSGGTKSIKLIEIPCPVPRHVPSKGYMRFINLSSLGPASLVQKNKLIFNQVEFCERTNYILSGEGLYHFIIKAPTITKNVDVTIGAGEMKTLFFLGNRMHNRCVAVKYSMPTT